MASVLSVILASMATISTLFGLLSNLAIVLYVSKKNLLHTTGLDFTVKDNFGVSIIVSIFVYLVYICGTYWYPNPIPIDIISPICTIFYTLMLLSISSIIVTITSKLLFQSYGWYLIEVSDGKIRVFSWIIRVILMILGYLADMKGSLRTSPIPYQCFGSQNEAYER